MNSNGDFVLVFFPFPPATVSLSNRQPHRGDGEGDDYFTGGKGRKQNHIRKLHLCYSFTISHNDRQADRQTECFTFEPSFLSFLQFVVILESVLAKLSRYDEGTLFSSFLSFTVRTFPGFLSPFTHGSDFSRNK